MARFCVVTIRDILTNLEHLGAPLARLCVAALLTGH